jgi:hypothetical protein
MAVPAISSDGVQVDHVDSYPNGVPILMESQIATVLPDLGLEGVLFELSVHESCPVLRPVCGERLSVESVGEVSAIVAGLLVSVLCLEYVLGGWASGDGVINFSRHLMARETRRLKLRLIGKLIAEVGSESPEVRQAVRDAVAV